MSALVLIWGLLGWAYAIYLGHKLEVVRSALRQIVAVNEKQPDAR